MNQELYLIRQLKMVIKITITKLDALKANQYQAGESEDLNNEGND